MLGGAAGSDWLLPRTRVNASITVARDMEKQRSGTKRSFAFSSTDDRDIRGGSRGENGEFSVLMENVR